MLEKLHEHIIDELRTNTKTDTVFTIISMLLNFIALAINWSIAGDDDAVASADVIVLVLFIVLVLLVNTVAVIGLLRGRQTRNKLLTGLLKLYKDQNVEGYYDSSILSAYDVRYKLFTITVAFTGFIAIAVPVVLLALK